MIEKLGHKKGMQNMRKTWIDEGKAKATRRVGEGNADGHGPKRRYSSDAQDLSRPSKGMPKISKSQEVSEVGTRGDTSERGGISGHNAQMTKDSAEAGLFISDDEAPAGEDPQDDLDAILAEEDSRAADKSGGDGGIGADNFADDEEAMAGFDDMW